MMLSLKGANLLLLRVCLCWTESTHLLTEIKNNRQNKRFSQGRNVAGIKSNSL